MNWSISASIRQHWRFANGLLVIVLLATGLLHSFWVRGYPHTDEGYDSGELWLFAAACLAVIPLLLKTLKTQWSDGTDAFSELLVAVAVLGALVSGEFVAAAIVPIILSIGHFLEQRSITGSQSAIDGLKRLRATTATRLTADGEESVETNQLAAGDALVVRPGDVIPADGLLTHGYSTVDESSITGESIPRELEPGSNVFAGTINLSGRVQMRVERVGQDSSLGRITDLLKNASQSKTQSIRSLERFARVIVPLLLLLSGFVYLITEDVNRVLTIFVVSCPCALALSGPCAMIASLGAASRQGVLVKHSKFLETLAETRHVVFDKTGTLTTGELSVHNVVANDDDPARVAEIAIRCARGSKHPISAAMVRYGESQAIIPHSDDGGTLSSTAEFEELPGRGVTCHYDGHLLRFGRPAWIRQELGLDTDSYQREAHDGPVAYVSADDRWIGVVHFSDRLRPSAKDAISDLRNTGVQGISLLSGDRQATVAAVARELGIHEFQSEALPEEKLRKVASIRDSLTTGSILTVGDGINDALALSASDVSMAIGSRGSDIAMHSADIVLTTSDLRSVAQSIRLARQTRSTVASNIALASGWGALMLTLGAAGWLSFIAGAALHHVGSLLVLINSARLLYARSSKTIMPAEAQPPEAPDDRHATQPHSSTVS